jgi:hypothetical protein
VKLYAGLDYGEFARQGEGYLASIWSPEYFSLQRKFASPNFVKEQEAAETFVANNKFELNRLAESEFVELLRENLIILQTQANLLFPDSGSGTHYVVLYAEDGDSIWLHDPGLAPRRSVRLLKAKVYAAYTGEIIAVPHGGRKFGPQ